MKTQQDRLTSRSTPTPRKVSSISQVLNTIRVEDAGTTFTSDQEVTIRPIRNDWELNEVYRMTHDAFLKRGYCKLQPDNRLIHYPHLDRIPETMVLVAIMKNTIVGTSIENIEKFLKQDGLRRIDQVRELFMKFKKLRGVEIARILGVARSTAATEIRKLRAEGFVKKIEPTASPRTHYFQINKSSK